MTENLPSGADLDANANEEATKAATAKSASDSILKNLTAKKPELTPGPETDEAIEYVKSKGYTVAAAKSIVQANGVDMVLKAKAHEEAKAFPPPSDKIPPLPRGPEGTVSVTKADQIRVSRHGEVFNSEIHAQLPTGDPKTDSTGRFILKQHDYAGPRPNKQFPA